MSNQDCSNWGGVKCNMYCIPPLEGTQLTMASLQDCLLRSVQLFGWKVCYCFVLFFCIFRECLKYQVYTARTRWRDKARPRAPLPIIPFENKLSSPLGCLQTDKNDCTVHPRHCWVEADKNKQHSVPVQSADTQIWLFSKQMGRDVFHLGIGFGKLDNLSRQLFFV